MDSKVRRTHTGGMTSRSPCDTPPDAAETVCPNCGWPEDVPYRVLSWHRTSTGVVVYTRCACGALQVRRQARSGGDDLLARGAPRWGRGCPGPRVRPRP
jgi:hypothetical protein